MESKYDNNQLEPAVGGASSASLNHVEDILGTESHSNRKYPYDTSGSLQLTPIYSNPRHQQERESIGDILNRYQGRPSSSYHGDYYRDNYEEDLEGHISFDARGAHVGVRMSRTHQTPSGNARIDVGMQMSIGHGGLAIRTSSSTSFSGGSHDRLLMLGCSEGSRYHSRHSNSMYQPMDSMMSPFCGLFSPRHGMFSQALGSYSCSHDSPVYGYGRHQTPLRNPDVSFESDGPLIEEIIDEEENEKSCLNDEATAGSYLAIEEMEDEIDPSLGLGLIAETEISCSDSDENNRVDNGGESLLSRARLFDDLAHSETSAVAKSRTSLNKDIVSDRDDTEQTRFRTLHRFKESQETAAEFYEVSLEKSTESPSNANNLLPEIPITTELTQSDDESRVIKDKVRGRQKFQNIPFQFKDVDASPPFLQSSYIESRLLNESRSNSQLITEIDCSQKVKVNANSPKKKSKRETTNKNMLLRRRYDSLYEEDKKVATESFESPETNDQWSGSSHQICSNIRKHSTVLDTVEINENLEGTKTSKTLTSKKFDDPGTTCIETIMCSENSDQHEMRATPDESCNRQNTYQIIAELDSSKNTSVDSVSDVLSLQKDTENEHVFERMTDQQTVQDRNISKTEVSGSSLGHEIPQFQSEPDFTKSRVGYDDLPSTLNAGRNTFESIENVPMSTKTHNILPQSNASRENVCDKSMSVNEYCREEQRAGQVQHNQQHLLNNNVSVCSGSSSDVDDTLRYKGCHGQYICDKCFRQSNCEHTHVFQYYSSCCQKNKYGCNDCGKNVTAEHYAKIKHDKDTDDIFEHPDWQFLNEYRDEQAQFTYPKPKTVKMKTNVNKNSGAKPKVSNPASKQSQTQSRKATKPSTYSSPAVDLGDLVESVGLVMKDVYPDGNCLFTSVCDQLRIWGDFSYTPQNLRHAAVEYLREHPNQDDGTPLLAFLADDERDWDKYLSSMRQNGHWGDHIVIWALAHVLNRRIVIYRGDTELQKTIVEPTGPMADTDRGGSMTSCDVATYDTNSIEGRDAISCVENQAVQAPKNVEEMYLGHISQSHYVSLRPKHWHKTLLEVLKNKETSSLIGSNPVSKQMDSSGDVSVGKEVFSFSSEELNYFLNYLGRSGFVKEFELKRSRNESESIIRFMICDYFNGLDYKFYTKANFEKARNSPWYYLSTPKDSTVVTDVREGRIKDLVVKSENCKVGQFRLTPVTPKLWKPNLKLCGNFAFLQHIEYQSTDTAFNDIGFIAFKCVSWPELATEWKNRSRPSDWPKQSIVEEIIENGVRAIPAKDKASIDSRIQSKAIYDKYPGNQSVYLKGGRWKGKKNSSKEGQKVGSEIGEQDLIWEYNFDISESILCGRDFDIEAKRLHCILATVTSFVFEGKDMITRDHIKALTFFTCERYSPEQIKHEPGTCLLFEINLLTDYLQRQHFPHYFMRGRNLITHMAYHDIEWHIERLQVLKTHLMSILYHVLDYCTLQNVFGVGKVFDGLVEVAVERGIGRKPKHTDLLPLCVAEVTNCATSKIFKHIKGHIDIWFKELSNTYGHIMISKEKFIHEVLLHMPLQEQWLFAFYLDCTGSSEFVQDVCKGKPCFKFKSLFGNEVAVILSREFSFRCEEILVPTVVPFDNMIGFALRLGDVLNIDIDSSAAYQTAIHHFLKTNTHDLLLSVEKDQKDFKDQYSHVKISDLRTLYTELYEAYNKQDVNMFKELMELYGELCNFDATASEFEFLAKLWTYFGENEKAREAHMKATSIKDEAFNCRMFQKHDVPDSHLTFAMKYIQMSEVIICRYNKEKLSSTHSDKSMLKTEVYTEGLDAMNSIILGGRNIEQMKTFISFMIPTDTHVYNFESRNKARIKDLLFDTRTSPPGYTKLIASDPLCWINSLDGDKCLKHLHVPPSFETASSSQREMYLAFCCEWPNDYKEWLARKRIHNWPLQNVLDVVRENGCRVIPQEDNPCQSPLVEWKIAFDKAEQVISEHAVTEAQKDCFIIVKLLLENNLDKPLTLQQIKHVFFFMCEETEEGLWKSEIARCVWMFLDRLKVCLRCRNIPNYFAPDISLIEDDITDEYISQCLACIDIVQRHPFVALFFICDNYSHMFEPINILFNRVIEDSKRYAANKNMRTSLRVCFIPLVAEGVCSLVQKHKYREALEKCRKATEQIDLLIEDSKDIHLEDVIGEVIYLSYRRLNQWLFALLVDLELGTLFTETVCENLPTVSLFDYYGPSLADYFRTQIGVEDVLIPLELVSLPNLPETTVYIIEIFENSCLSGVYGEILDYFCSHHLSRLMLYTNNMPKSAFPVTCLQIIMIKINMHAIKHMNK